ncbi:hypothetical protein OCB69_20925 [Bacillus cereus]|nr:hypothetical protein [Bacillus cereus]
MDVQSIVALVSDPKFVVGILSLGGVIYTVRKTVENVNKTNDLKKELDEQTNKLKKELADQTNKITKELGEKNIKALEQRRYIDAISAERIKWINTMRDRFSEYIKLVHLQMNDFLEWQSQGDAGIDENELRKRFFDITYVNNQINLLVNQTEPIVREMLNIQSIQTEELGSPKDLSKFNYQKHQEMTDDLSYLYQVVLKAEWKRVKEENKKGEEISDEEVNYIYTEVAKNFSNKKYNKYFGQSES